jgi:hypothetical protein
VAIGITETQRMSSGSLKEALRANGPKQVLRDASWPFVDGREVTLVPASDKQKLGVTGARARIRRNSRV